MPILPPRLDDRSFEDLRDELLERIPAHTPEWTHPRQGDPGRTLIELFAWLGDALLYRANLIPERQRLAFLRLLGAPLRPAIAARGLVSVQPGEESAAPVTLRPGARLAGAVEFETRSELTVLPVTGEAYVKRPLTEGERKDLSDLLPDLRQVYRLGSKETALPYVTTPLFADGLQDAAGFDVINGTVDNQLWLALLAADPERAAQLRESGGEDAGSGRLLSVGAAPVVRIPQALSVISSGMEIPHVWQVTSGREIGGQPEYLDVDRISDSTDGLSRTGVERLSLPGMIGVPPIDPGGILTAGLGDRPPRLDDADRTARLVAWLRLRPTGRLQSLLLSWVGINAVEIDQRATLTGIVAGVSTGAVDQEIALPRASVEPESLDIGVEEGDRGYVPWTAIEDLGIHGRDARVFELDSEAGTLRFGDGVRGRVPPAGGRIRVASLRAGGGSGGNLPPGSLNEITATDLDGSVFKGKIIQPLPTEGGEDAETLVEAESRIPDRLRHRNRAVTGADYRRLATDAPGVRLGRVEVLPRFKPQQRRSPVPGVVSVMVLPLSQRREAPNPRPDRPTIERVHAYLNERRPLATELYVIGCEYVPLGLAVAVSVRAGFGHDQVPHAVRQAVRDFLWSLPPGGADGEGWPLGRQVSDRELEVVAARVPGVSAVAGVNLFTYEAGAPKVISPTDPSQGVRLALDAWQLPELLALVVVEGNTVPTDLGGRTAAEDETSIPVPLVPEVCS